MIPESLCKLDGQTFSICRAGLGVAPLHSDVNMIAWAFPVKVVHIHVHIHESKLFLVGATKGAGRKDDFLSTSG